MTTLLTGTARTESWIQLRNDEGTAARRRILDGLWARRDAFITSAFGGHPAVGDIVVEVTRALWSPDEAVRAIGFGFYLGRDGDTHYVQYGEEPGDVCDWGNCALATVPPALIGRLTR